MGSLSLEFASRETDGLLLYGGPTSPVRNGGVHDFITVELAGGKVLVSLSLGDRNDIVRVGVTSGMALNDGEWHHVEVYRNGTVSYECDAFPVNFFLSWEANTNSSTLCTKTTH